MDVLARLTSKGRVTVPKSVRDALGVAEGDQIVFRVESSRAILARTASFLDLAGSVEVPAVKRNVPWDEVIRRTRVARADRIADAAVMSTTRVTAHDERHAGNQHQ